MGEIADWMFDRAMVEDFEYYLNNQKAGNQKMYQKPIRYTEDILNSDKWVTTHGEILEIKTMNPDHLRNVLKYLYKSKDSYWLNCRDGKLIEQFENGEDFFQRVVRKSTLWTTAIETLTQTNYAGFNFEWEGK